MRRIYKSMIWVSVLALSAGAVSAQKAERKNVREGNKLYESEKYTESEIAYRKSLEVNPRSTEGTYNLGNSLYKQGKFPEAAEQYQLIAGQGEKMVATPEGKARLSEVYHNMGNIFMQNKDYGKAVEVYKQSLRLNPKDDVITWPWPRNCCRISRIRIRAKINRTTTSRRTRIRRTISSNSNNNSRKTTRSRIRPKSNSNPTSK